MSGPPEGETPTIGVAIAVPQPFADDLQRWRAEFGDPLAHSIPAHVTLLPPTPVPVSQLADVREHLSAAAASRQPFDLRLRGTGTFRPVSPVVFVRVAQGVDECADVEQVVRSGPLERGLDFAYHPHVTVAHDVPAPALDRALATLEDYDATFEVSGFDLFEHGDDGVWRPRVHFPFTPASTAGARPGASPGA